MQRASSPHRSPEACLFTYIESHCRKSFNRIAAQFSNKTIKSDCEKNIVERLHDTINKHSSHNRTRFLMRHTLFILSTYSRRLSRCDHELANKRDEVNIDGESDLCKVIVSLLSRNMFE